MYVLVYVCMKHICIVCEQCTVPELLIRLASGIPPSMLITRGVDMQMTPFSYMKRNTH